MTFLIRPANINDLQPIYEMAKRTGGGFTNLPPDKRALSEKLERSAAGFDRADDAVADDLYLFVLQNSQTGEVRGTCQIFGQVGQRWPFYSYRIGALTQHSVELERTFRDHETSIGRELRRARVEQARADRDEAEAQYRKAVLGALSDAETSLTRFGNQRRNLFSSVASRNGARQSATYAGQRYAQGAIPLTTSIDAERAGLAADQSVLEATGELDRAFIALQKAMGLGWSQQ